MKKKLFLFVMLIAICSLAVSFTACNKNTGSTEKDSIELNYYVYEMDLLEDFTLKAIVIAVF